MGLKNRISKLSSRGSGGPGKRRRKDPEKSATIFREIDGERYVVAGDYARLEDDGTITLLGRGNVSINTGGWESSIPDTPEARASHEQVNAFVK